MRLFIVVSAMGLAGIGSAQSLVSFESSTEITKPVLEKTLATVSQGTVGRTEGSSSLVCNFSSAPTGTPGFNYVFTTPRDFTMDGLVGIDITNLNAKTIRGYFGLTDANGARTLVPVDIKSGETRAVGLEIRRALASTYGLRSLPIYFQSLNFGKQEWPVTFDITKVKKIGVNFRYPATPFTMAFDNIRVSPAFDWRNVLTRTVDRYGQRTWGGVAGQIANISDLLARKAEESISLLKPEIYPDRNTRGSWVTGPKLANSSGFFKTVKYMGKWYFLDPEGYLFFSSGLDGTSSADSPTPITGREYMFDWLPSLGDILEQFKSVERIGSLNVDCYNFTAANIYSKYGSIAEPWAQTTDSRMRNWGFNTVGCFTDLSMRARTNLPYIVELDCDVTAVKFSVKNSANLMPDPFDAKFQSSTETQLANYMKWYGYNRDPNLIGYFSENELPFGTYKSAIDMPVSILGYASTKLAAKRALISRLKSKYGLIEALNASWGMTYTSWAILEGLSPVLPTTDPEFVADLKEFVSVFAARFTSVWKSSVRKYDPNHMYLGTKLGYFDEQILSGMNGQASVFMFNKYGPVLPAEVSILSRYDRPCMLGEYGASSPRANNFAFGLTDAGADSEAGRAEIVESMLRSVLANPYFVGAHFFKLYDDPVVGSHRGGQNVHWGMCDVTDTPYPEMVTMFKKVNKDIYKR